MTFAIVLLGPLLVHAGPDDAAEIQGTWQVAEFVMGGTAVPEERFREMRFVFTADRMTLISAPGRDKREYTYKLDPVAKPKAIDTVPLDGPFKGKTGPAIYNLDGDTLKLCIPNRETKDRPAEFKSEPGSNLGLFVLRRVKAKP